ncbi:MAG: hypothetical protein IAF38_12665 [Bacteroidia bacterium]|nr:hypothetical protein [Bacteroidia bacterium]
MKKIFFSLLFLSFASLGFSQFVNGLGFFIAGEGSRHKYKDSNDPATYGSHKGKLLFRPAGGIVADFGNSRNLKWRTEFEYNMQGSTERVANPDGATQKYKNKLDYISWNNFMKIQGEVYAGFPYILLGPRVEYLFRNKPQAYVPVMSGLSKFQFSWDVGAGFEFMAYGPARLFAEYHYHSDLKALYKRDNLKVNNLTHELRVGIMFKFADRKNSCNAPTYSE